MERNSLVAGLAISALSMVGFGRGSSRFGSYRAPVIPTNHKANLEAAQQRRSIKAAKRADVQARGLANYHPIAQAAAETRAASTETFVKPKRVRKPAAAKAA